MNENAMLFSFREDYHIREIRRMKSDSGRVMSWVKSVFEETP
jgi:hypothetical protein